MNIQERGDILSISGLTELGASNSDTFRNRVRAALPRSVKAIEIDLSQISFVDSYGLGALVAVHKTATQRNNTVALRLLNPTPPVQQIFELTRLHRIFEIVKREPDA